MISKRPAPFVRFASPRLAGGDGTSSGVIVLAKKARRASASCSCKKCCGREEGEAASVSVLSSFSKDRRPTRITTIWSSNKISTSRLKCGLVESVGQGRAVEGPAAVDLEPVDALSPFALALGAIRPDKEQAPTVSMRSRLLWSSSALLFEKKRTG